MECGARAGSRSPQLAELLEQARSPQRSSEAAAPTAAPPPAPDQSSARRRLLATRVTLPSWRVLAPLVLAFLGFGVIVGAAAGSRVNGTPTAARQLKVLLPASAPEGAAPAQSAPPSSEAESTPSPASEPEEAQSTGQGAGASTKANGKGAASGGSAGSSGASGGGGKGSSGAGGKGSSGTSGQGTHAGSTKPGLPAIGHVFVLMLDDQPYVNAFGPQSQARYLQGELEHKGALLVRYYGVAHQQLANAIALVSGQGPTQQTAQNCPTYENLVPGTIGADGQAIGQGCVYPEATPTLASQLRGKGLGWRAYIQGIEEASSGQPACAHPALGASDPSAATTPPAGQAYATWRNPFVYFQAVTNSPACTSDDVGIGQLASDLRGVESTPSFSYIVPDLCHDGNPNPCAPGAPAGMAAAEGFLKEVVPKILSSPAYKSNGMLVITVDQAPSSGEFADTSACCGQSEYPNLPASNSPLGPEGGGQVGALLLSPFIKTHAVSQEPYNHFSLLRTIEDIFGLSHLGYAAGAKVNSFEPSLFSSSG